MILDEMQQFMAIMTDIFYGLPRQGPGSIQTTQRALALCNQLPSQPVVLDSGCGTGMHTRTLAENLNDATIIGYDFIHKFVSEAQQLTDDPQVHMLQADMNHLPVALQSVDLIWAEGSAYSIGFESALQKWYPFLRKGGYLAVSELVWLKPNAPTELQQFWADEYPAMQDRSRVESILTTNRYSLVDQFILPETDWLAYYQPIEDKIPALRDTYQQDVVALSIIDMLVVEIEMYHQYSDYYGYVFSIVRV